jgi:predicted site-specific integrase-resolvase
MRSKMADENCIMRKHESDFLSSQDAARILGVGIQTVRAYQVRGLLPSIQTPSGLRIYLRDDVERLAPRVPLKRGRRVSA